MILQTNLDYMWSAVVKPRLGVAPYTFGGSFSPDDPTVGTDCSGAVSAELEALLYGPNMTWGRQFWTGTFAKARPGDVGPFDGVAVTAPLLCIASPADAPLDAAMIIAVLQDPDPSSAHMICQVQGVNIEMGGPTNSYISGPSATDIHNSEFTQWFFLPGPIVGRPPTRQQRYALTIIQTGESLGITPLGCQMALACGLVESNLQIYANSNVPESLNNYPHDAVGSDHDSCGIFQQRASTGWGTVADEMDVAKSAAMFYNALAKLPYNSGAQSPGSYVQEVQRSAFPDRYDQRFGDAVALYDSVINQQGFLMSLSDQQQTDVYTWLGDLHGAMFNSVPSQSPFRHLTEPTHWKLHELIKNDDGFVHPQYVQWAAEHGDPVSLSVLQEVASANPADFPDRVEDIKLAQQVMAQIKTPNTPVPEPAPGPVIHAAPVTPTPAPAPNPGTLTINTAQIARWLKDAATILGALATWATTAHNVLGQFLPGATGVAVPAALALGTVGLSAHTVAQKHSAQTALARIPETYGGKLKGWPAPPPQPPLTPPPMDWHGQGHIDD